MRIGLIVLKLLVSANFILVGSMKVAGVGDTVSMFVHYGYPAWLCMIVGLGETVGGISLWIKKWVKYALWVLSIIMIGALVTHFMYKEYLSALIICFYLLLLAVIAIAGRPLRAS